LFTNVGRNGAFKAQVRKVQGGESMIAGIISDTNSNANKDVGGPIGCQNIVRAMRNTSL
jgi:hypothetical protein